MATRGYIPNRSLSYDENRHRWFEYFLHKFILFIESDAVLQDGHEGVFIVSDTNKTIDEFYQQNKDEIDRFLSLPDGT